RGRRGAERLHEPADRALLGRAVLHEARHGRLGRPRARRRGHARDAGPRLDAGRPPRRVGSRPPRRPRRDAGHVLGPLWEKGQVDGKHMSIALDAHPFVLFYNTDICGEAGVLDADGRLKKVSSPREFLEMVAAVAEASEGHGLSYGYLGDG